MPTVVILIEVPDKDVRLDISSSTPCVVSSFTNSNHQIYVGNNEREPKSALYNPSVGSANEILLFGENQFFETFGKSYVSNLCHQDMITGLSQVSNLIPADINHRELLQCFGSLNGQFSQIFEAFNKVTQELSQIHVVNSVSNTLLYDIHREVRALSERSGDQYTFSQDLSSRLELLSCQTERNLRTTEERPYPPDVIARLHELDLNTSGLPISRMNVTRLPSFLAHDFSVTVGENEIITLMRCYPLEMLIPLIRTKPFFLVKSDELLAREFSNTIVFGNNHFDLFGIYRIYLKKKQTVAHFEVYREIDSKNHSFYIVGHLDLFCALLNIDSNDQRLVTIQLSHSSRNHPCELKTFFSLNTLIHDVAPNLVLNLFTQKNVQDKSFAAVEIFSDLLSILGAHRTVLVNEKPVQPSIPDLDTELNFKCFINGAVSSVPGDLITHGQTELSNSLTLTCNSIANINSRFGDVTNYDDIPNNYFRNFSTTAELRISPVLLSFIGYLKKTSTFGRASGSYRLMYAIDNDIRKAICPCCGNIFENKLARQICNTLDIAMLEAVMVDGTEIKASKKHICKNVCHHKPYPSPSPDRPWFNTRAVEYRGFLRHVNIA